MVGNSEIGNSPTDDRFSLSLSYEILCAISKSVRDGIAERGIDSCLPVIRFKQPRGISAASRNSAKP
jgi:hypothetical protein